MDRLRKNKNSLDETIAKQEEAVTRAREKYDAEVKRLKDLYAKRDEQKKKMLMEAVKKSNKSYEEIMAFLTADMEG